MIDPGDISCTGVLPQGEDIGGTAVGLQALQNNRTLASWTITEPISSLLTGQTQPGVWAFSAYVVDLALDIQYEKESVYSLKLGTSGPYTFTPAS
jgi:hypothetical protein